MTHSLSFDSVKPGARCAAALAALSLLGACASKDVMGYGVGPQAERAVMAQQASKDPAPDTPGMYLGLIDQMQSQGLYFASLAHIDAYDKQYGASPDSILLRADALRMTDQPAAAANAYGQLLKTPLATRGYRGLGLIAGAAGDFGRAAQELQQAVQLAPTDATTLSDLGYARLRDGDVDGARVPLMKAAELDQTNPKIVSNVALYLLANGNQAQALAVMNQQKLAPDVRAAIRSDAAKVAAAARVQIRGAPLQQDSGALGAGARTVASAQGIEPAPRLLQRFAQ
ncbi:Flp pilus assembly protein TadD [Paraburkholderia sp. BL6665CI2N2]|uniref:tetratricopeptide repeat protein n=1 Tax=Paraburkholderia sp. BL6665CI2N2 TaxID=1938806 RepID=UPI001064B553|nr:pilus assembly protein [Paraburkholderia sp. BL6665CI2N2]TDY26212.1 Flp pilus assembly protein TadD [Paraburkholderia sp. BL6665CI2N2]